MRNSFVTELSLLAKDDPNIFLITGDLGFGVLDDFERQFPNQYLNAGIAEQSMLGAAAGMASRGFKVFVYSIANFPTFRALEQVRNDISYMGNQVTIVSVGAGLSYGNLGYSHHAVEDIAIMRSIPNIDIYSPCDPSDVGPSLRNILINRNAAYLRLGKGGEEILDPVANQERIPFRLLKTGKDGVLIFSGAIGKIVLEAAISLEKLGQIVSVVGLNCLNDTSLEALVNFTKGLPTVSIEEHRLQGGIGSWLLEGFSDRKLIQAMSRVGLKPNLESAIGSRDYLLSLHGLTPNAIVQKYLDLVG